MQNIVADKRSKKVLNEDQIKSYREKGFISIKEFVKDDWLTDLQTL